MIQTNFISNLMKMIIILITVIDLIKYPKGIYLFCLFIKQFMKIENKYNTHTQTYTKK